MLTLNLSGNLSTISKSLLPEWTYHICGGNASQCLCVSQNPAMLGGDDDDTRTQGDDGDYGPFEVQAGDDKSKGDGSHDDPHNDVVARLERCLDIVMDDPGVPTTPQFTPIESVSAWIAWSQGLTWDKCPCEDKPDNYQCPWCS
jgi:hypothetical protein